MRRRKQTNSVPICAMESLENRQLFSAAPLVPALASAPAAIKPNPLSVSFNSQGISKLSYNGSTLFNAATNPGGVFAISDYNVTSNGITTDVYVNPTMYTSTWNATRQILTFTFNWGSVGVKYSVAGQDLNMAITIDNSSTATIGGIDIYPLFLTFPTMPAGFAGEPVVQFGDESPGVTVADFGTGSVAFVEQDAGENYYNGFMSTSTNILSTTYRTWIGSKPLWYQPGNWPTLQDNVSPETSVVYHTSYRFGPTGSTAESLAPDLLQSYVAAHPDTVAWTNRAPIGMLFPAGSSPSTRSATNPNGWFADPSVNVTTPAGLAAFSNELLQYAQNSVTVLKNMGAQGMITWDIEGEQYQNADYVGDPRLATTLAPELAYDNLIDQYFATFRNAGLEVGVTIRAQEFEFNNGSPIQVAYPSAAAEVKDLVAKIDYAQSNWGCTLFYIDSNSASEDPSIMARVHKQCPGMLLIPEQSNPGDYASAAPFGDLRLGATQTSAAVTQVYSNAFNVIDTNDGNITAAESQLVQGVEEGDILLFSGWYNSSNNAIVKQIYQEAASAQAAAHAAQLPALASGANSQPTSGEIPLDELLGVVLRPTATSLLGRQGL